MKRKRIERVRLDRDGRLRSNGRIVHARVDRSRLNSSAAFAPDEDAPVLTAREISSFRRVKPLKAIDPRMVRKRLRMSQTAFAHVFAATVRTVQEWEQHRRKPAGAARALFQVIDPQPEAAPRAIGL